MTLEARPVMAPAAQEMSSVGIWVMSDIVHAAALAEGAAAEEAMVAGGESVAGWILAMGVIAKCMQRCTLYEICTLRRITC